MSFFFLDCGLDTLVVALASGWTVWGSNACGAKFSAPVQTGPVAHPASWVPGLFSEVKYLGRGIDHLPVL